MLKNKGFIHKRLFFLKNRKSYPHLSTSKNMHKPDLFSSPHVLEMHGNLRVGFGEGNRLLVTVGALSVFHQPFLHAE